jgi:hypothetical protein
VPTVAVASYFGGSAIFLPSSIMEGGDTMQYITWNDLIQIALLIFAIISCFYNKKDNRPAFDRVSGYLFNR